MPYSNDEIKKWLDEAVKKIQASPEKADPDNADKAGNDSSTEAGSPSEMGSSSEVSSSMGEGSSTEVGSSTEMSSPIEVGSSTETGSSSVVGSSTETGSSSEVGSSIERGTSKEVGSSTETGSSSEVGSPGEKSSGEKSSAAQKKSAPAGTSPPAAQKKPAPAGTKPPTAQKKPAPTETKPPAAQKKSAPAGTSPPAAQKKSAPAGTKPPAAQKKPAPTGTKPPAAPQSQATAESQPASTPRKPAANQTSGPAAALVKEPAKQEASTDKRGAASRGKNRAYDATPDRLQARQQDDSREFDTGPDNFKIKFDFDGVYKDVPEEKPLRLRRERRTGCVGGLLYSVFVICISLILASLVWMAVSDVLGFATNDETVNIVVPNGFDMDDIIDRLFGAGLIRYKFLFKLYADYSHAEDKISAGSYILNKNYDYRALVYGMTKRSGILREVQVTIPEGFTLAEIFLRLEDYNVCPAADLWDAATNHDFNYSFLDKSTKGERLRLEGFLFPDTYNFYVDSQPEQVITKLLDEFNGRFTETYTERAEFMGYSVRDIITIASMIEREAGSDEERPRIAAVIYNRLNNTGYFPYLQIDATLNYAVAGTDRPPSTDIDSPYNTYLHEGLPPGPIANPGIESIRAALYPDSTDEYYYALNMEGTHAFFRTLAQHEAFIASDDYGGR